MDSIAPLVEHLSKDTVWGFSLHLLCATRRGHYEGSIEKLLDRCPQAIIAYANHHLQDKNMVRANRNGEVFPFIWGFFQCPRVNLFMCEGVLVAEAAP